MEMSKNFYKGRFKMQENSVIRRHFLKKNDGCNSKIVV